MTKSKTAKGYDGYIDRVRNRMEHIDGMPADVRSVVHDYGYTIVMALQQGGVKKGRNMRHIIRTVIEETRGGTRPDGENAGSSQSGAFGRFHYRNGRRLTKE